PDRRTDSAPALLAAADPANPFGAALPWPSPVPGLAGPRPGRKAGAVVVIQAGELLVYLERGGKSTVTFSTEDALLTAAAQTLAGAVQAGKLPGLTIERHNGEPLLSADSPWRTALLDAGFHLTARGARCRR
ncbi:MAG: hypothetical protein ACRC0L_04645, partial [Angustibacter sp.]